VVADEPLYGRALSCFVERASDAEVRFAGAVGDLGAIGERAPADVVIWVADTVDDETMRPLRDIRARRPEIGLVVVGRDIDPSALATLLSADPHGFAVVQRGPDTHPVDIEVAVRQVLRGHSSFDASVMDRLVSGPDNGNGPLRELTEVELTVLALVARGLRNEEIARRIDKSTKTVEKHVGRIFEKLGLSAGRHPQIERRVAAALVYIQEQ